jgi:putative drug exporter of the RND superfamily
MTTDVHDQHNSTQASDRGTERARSATAAWAVKYRWWVLPAALAVLAGSVFTFVQLGLVTTDDADQLVGDSATAEKIVEKADFGGKPTEQVVITRRTGTFGEADLAPIGEQATSAYADVEGLTVQPSVLGVDRRTIIVPVELDADDDTKTDLPSTESVARPMLAATEDFADANPDLIIGQIGDASADIEVNETIEKDFQRAELYSLPLTLLILLVAFGAVVAAGVPLLLGLGSVGVAFGLSALVSHYITPVDANAQSLVLLIGLAVGVDYALFILRRSHEERAAGANKREAVIRAGATAGRAVVISGLTVMVAMSGMLVAGGLFTSLAIGTLIVIGVAIIASVTVLPALLAVLGDRVNALRLPFTKRRQLTQGSIDSRWGRLAGMVVRRPLAWAVASGLLLIALATPALGMKTALPGIEGLPDDLRVVDAYQRLQTAAPWDGTTIQLVVKADPADAEAVRAALLSTTASAEGIEHISGADPEPRTSLDRSVTLWDLGVDLEDSDDRLPGVVDQVRGDLVPEVKTALTDAGATDVHVGGVAAGTDLASWMDARLPWVVGFVLILTLVIMLVSFGSPWLAMATVLLNGLSVAAAYGVITGVFQNTWAEDLLGFTSIGSIASWIPMLMFVVLFGLSMDYHIFVTSRVREAFTNGSSARDAVREGVAKSAGVVTSAAAVMIGVFAIFGTLSTLEMKQLGVGLAAAILLDATIVRGILLPATLALLGERAHHGPRWLPQLHH